MYQVPVTGWDGYEPDSAFAIDQASFALTPERFDGDRLQS
jgi:hypothetical protein